MIDKFSPIQDAVFTVLNDWLDLDQSTFEKLWPELRDSFEQRNS